MSFIITYSPHTPYNYSKRECQENLKAIEELELGLNEEQTCALSSARETDNMFKELIKKLKKEGLLEDTIIVGFTDHPNKIVLKDDETDKLNKTLFFIYNSDMDSNQITTISSTIDILPTIKNLFSLQNEYIYPGNDLLNIKENNIVFSDYTYYNGKDILPLTKSMVEDLEYSKGILITNYYK
jgi:phosphoglycerol transferase MdoB-like AlkP superfamily enzyme